MTRITNFGRKRTYLEATSQLQDNLEPQTTKSEDVENVPAVETDDLAPPPKKKRKRTKPSMRDGNTGVKAAAERERKMLEAEARAAEGKLSTSAKKRMREKAKKEKALPISELRRLRRIKEKLEATTCYACRQKGHAAKDCPNTEKSSEDTQNAKIVGICYRCGSLKHILSRCKKSVDEANPLPFASCFVCNGKGPMYSVLTHVRITFEDYVETKDILGIGDAAGADEDDFHSFKRQKIEIDRFEKHDEKEKRARAGHLATQSNTLRSTKCTSLPSKRVVYF
ncbi:hypothetical protein C0995_009886 [Termitomyces sp. Mi166|nr:hypothetical protein C0995_009886 [Termitomyces sp. Mi166\